MPKFAALWAIPLRRDWDLYAKGSGIPVIAQASRMLILTTPGRTTRSLQHCREIVRLHNAQVRATIKAQKKAANVQQNQAKPLLLCKGAGNRPGVL